jgi:tetratricopeptide (TPR) repeat protein
VTSSGDRDVAERIASAAGLVAQQFPIEEIFWATRRLLERLAKDRPVVVVFEDIHWAEATLLDLIERVARSVADAPVLVICAARPTFAEIRPGGLDVPGAVTIELPPLSAEESALVVDSLLGTAEIDERARERIVSAAEGNPLYVEQLLSMLIDDGVLRREGERWSPTVDLSDLQIPPTIHALLAARLDLLSREERAVIEPASVIGLYFAQQAVEELVPDVLRAEVSRHLAALTGKQLVQSGEVDVALGASFRFHHVLIRDTAYQALLKRTRATFHERFADWGERVNRDLGRETEYEEILGYHLEQAYLYLADLGPVDDHGRTVARRAADRLAAAGQRAFARDDMPAAANLLRRAVELMPEREPARLRLLPELGEAMMQVGELAWAEVFLDEAIATAAELGDEGVGTDARLVRLFAQGYGDAAGDDWGSEALREAERAVAIFERTNDHRRLAKAWRLAGDVHGIASRFGQAATAAGHAAAHARLAGDGRQEARAASQHAMAAAYGPTPVAEAIELCERALAQPQTTRRTKGLVMCLLARMKAKNGDFEEARDLYARARSTLEEVGGPLLAASTSMDSAAVELLAGDPEAAERELRRDYEALDRLGETLFRPTVAAYLARTLCIQGRYEEAEDYAQVAEEVASPDDLDSQALWRCVKATILLQSGRLDEAEVLAQEAVEVMRPTDGLVRLADALVVLAAVYERQGRMEEGRRALAEALSLYERKGNIAALRAARATFFGLSV